MRTASERTPYLSRPFEELAAALPEEEEEDEELPEEEEDEVPFTFSSILASVFAPAMPSAERPFFRWKFITAASVMLP